MWFRKIQNSLHFFRICAAVFTQIYIGFFKPDVLAFILFLAISLGGVSLLGVIFIQLLSPITKATDSTPLVQKDATPSQKTGWRQYLEILKLLDFWIMLSIFGMVAGAGFVIFNNLGNLVLSLVYFLIFFNKYSNEKKKLGREVQKVIKMNLLLFFRFLVVLEDYLQD